MRPVLCGVFMAAFLFASLASADENDLFKALLRVQKWSSASWGEYVRLIKDADVEFDVVKTQKTINPEFLRVSEECVTHYKKLLEIDQQSSAKIASTPNPFDPNFRRQLDTDTDNMKRERQAGDACVDRLLQIKR